MTFKIYPTPSISNWKFHPIYEYGEELISLHDINNGKLSIIPIYFKQSVPYSIYDCLVQKTVGDMLLDSTSFLPKGYKLVIWDSWRPLEVQRFLFEQIKNQFRIEFPHFDGHELMEYTQRFVPFPSHDPTKPSPHYTGGPIDLTICNESEEYLDMGTEFDEMNKKANTRYYEELEESGHKLNAKEKNILHNRRFLYQIMTEIGFTNYHEEWWHFDYGNQFWGKISD